MSNIGYAVFGSPKGIAVESNGLFKNLNLDKSLYLNSAHIVLDRGEQVLMIRRIPSNLNNLEKKDALLVVLYENALQYGENRPGGFVGSAICFKDQMPNAEKMMSGLFFLFQKIKENVDADNRFKAIDSSNWNITLPDANRDFGLEDSKLNFAPFSTSNKNVIIKLNSLERDAKSILYNFALNQSLHAVDYLYASTNNTVVDKIKANNFHQLPLAELFNYNKQLGYCKERLDKENEKLKLIKTKLNTEDNSLKRLESDIINKNNAVKKIEKEISEAKNDLTKALNNKKEAQRQLEELKRLGNRNYNPSSKNPSNQNHNSDKIIELQTLLKKVAKTVEDNTNIDVNKFKSSDRDEKNKQIVEYYINKLPKRKAKKGKIIIGVFSALLVLLLTFVGLFIWKAINFNKYIEETQVKVSSLNKVIDDQNKNTENTEKELEYINSLRNTQKGSANSDPIKFKELAAVLLKKHLEGKTSSVENKFIVEHKWQFWEFDYKDDALVNRLSPNSKKTYFITIENEIKQLKPQVSWRGEDKIAEQLENYMKEPNDIYQNVNPEVLKDSNLIESHFKYVIESENGEIDDLKKGQKIKLPFLKI